MRQKNSVQWRIPCTAKHKNSPDGDVKEYILILKEIEVKLSQTDFIKCLSPDKQL